ncbi:unnamed protein product [Arabidopsis halleri]
MELELGLKITRTREDVSSSVDFRFSKDPFGPLVLSRETDSRFIIIIHLKGFKKEGIEIDINEEGNRIMIKGRKPVEEMVMIRWMAWRKEVEFRGFKKAFRIPDIVDLDMIKARFDDDDATLTITMPKRVKGISGFKIEEEEEERVEFGDVSEAEHKEETEKGEFEEESIERQESDVHSEKFETEFQKEGELADSNKESEDSNLRKPPDIEGQEPHEQTSHEEQENNQQLVQAEGESDEFGSKALEEIEEQEPDEQLDRTSESGAAKKKTTGDGLSKVQGIKKRKRRNDERKIPEMVDKIHELVEKKEEEGENAKVRRQSEDRSLIKLQENEEQHSKGQKQHIEQEKIKELLEEKIPEAETYIGNDITKPVQEIKVPKVDTVAKTGDEGKEGKETEKSEKMEIKNGDGEEELDAKMGEGLTPNIAETATKAEKDNAKDGTQSEGVSLTKLQEIGEQQFQKQKQHDIQEEIKELVEAQTPEAETNIVKDSLKQFQEIEVPELDMLAKTGDYEGKEGKEKKKSVKLEINNGDDAKMGVGFAPNISETERKSEEFESDKLKADKVDKIKKLVEKKDKQEENAKVGAQRDDISLTKLQEIGEKQFQGQKQHGKQEKIKEVVEEKIPEAETNLVNDTPKPVQERCEGKQKIQNLFQEKTNNQPEEYKESIIKMGKKINNARTRKVQEVMTQQELDKPARSGKESKTRESVKTKTNDEVKEEKAISQTETKEQQESYRPQTLGEQEKVQELAEEKINFSRNGKVKEEEEIAEKNTEYGVGDDISRKVRDIEQRDSDAMKGQEEKGMIQELVPEEKIRDGGKGIIAVAETKAENDKSNKVQEIDEQQMHEEDICGKQFQELIEREISGHGEVEDVEKEKKTTEAGKKIKDRAKEVQKIEKTDSDVCGKNIKRTTIQELEENRETYRNRHEEEKKDDRPEKITGTIEQELVNLNSQLEQDNVEDGEKTQELVEEENKNCQEEESREESKTKADDDVARKGQGIKEQELCEPTELVEEKTGDHEKEETECGSLRKVDSCEEQELHEPKIHKERDKSRITGAKEPSGQEKEKIVESMEITENDNSKNVQEIKEERPDRLESHGKKSRIQEVVEAAKVKLGTERESSERQYDELKRSMVHDKMQETEESEKTRALEENEIVKRRSKTKDGGLINVRYDDDPELTKPYNRQKEDKIQELVETGTSDYREKVKKQDEDDILRSQEASKPELDEFERHDEQRNVLQLVDEEEMKNIAELERITEYDSSGKCHDFEERKSNEDWTHEEREKRKDLVKEEATDPKDKHTGGKGHNDQKEEQQEEKVIAKAELKTEEDSLEKVREIEKQEYDELQRSMVQDKMQETEEKEKNRVMEENEIVKRRKQTKDGSLGKLREGDDPALGKQKRYGEEDRIQELVETELNDHRRKDGDDILRSQETGKLDLGDLERHCKQRKIHQLVNDEAGRDQEHEEAGESAAVVASNEKRSSKKVKPIEEESEKQKEQNQIPETSDHEVKEEDEERVGEKETKELEAHVQELNEKTENCKDNDGDGWIGEKGKQGKTVETMSCERFKTKSDDGIVKKIRDTKEEESDEKKNQERKESSNHEVKLVAEDGNLRYGPEFLEKESNVSKRGQVEQEKIQEVKDVEKQDRVNQDEEKAAPKTKIDDGKSRKFEMVKMLEVDESEEHKKIRKPMEEKSNAPEKEKEGNEKIAGKELLDKIDRRVKDQEIKGQEPYGEHDKIPEYHTEDEKGMEQRETEEMKRTAEDVIPENESMASSQSQDIEGKGSDQAKRYAEQENIQELMTDEDEKEKCHISEREQNEKAKRILQKVESKANDDSSEKNETEGHQSTGLRGRKKNENHQELVELETSDQKKVGKEEEVVGRAEIIEDEYDSSRKIHEHEERKSDKLERHGEEEMSETLAEEETSNGEEAKEGNRAGAKIRYDGFGKVREIGEQEQDKKQSFVEKDTSGKAKKNKNHETESRDDSSRKTQEIEKQESHGQKQKRKEEQEKKNLGLVEKKKEVDETAEAEVPRNLKRIEKRESTKVVEKHEHRDNIKELVEEKMNNHEGEDKKSVITQVLAKAKEYESKVPEGLRKQDKSREQRLRDNLKDEETAKTETKTKDNESRKVHQIKETEQERLKEQGRIKELVEDMTHFCRETEFEDGSSKNIQERDKEESIKPGRDEKGDKIQEPVDMETSEDDEEELEIEFADEEEDWEADVIQETDSNEDHDKIRQIKRIRLGFRLVGGSTLFMSLIVIVISFIRSKRQIRCYKF